MHLSQQKAAEIQPNYDYNFRLTYIGQLLENRCLIVFFIRYYFVENKEKYTSMMVR